MIDEHTTLVYGKIVKQPMVTQRDMLQKCSVFRGDSTGVYVITFEDIDHDKFRPTKACIRLKTLVGGYVIRSTREGSVVCSINQTDVGMKSAIVNVFAVKAPVQWHGKLLKQCLKERDAAPARGILSPTFK